MANTNEASLRLLSTEASYVQSVLEETLDEMTEAGTHLALNESVAKSRERMKEKTEIGYILDFFNFTDFLFIPYF